MWMQDELYLSGWEIEEISKTLTKHGDEVNTLVEKAASERAARYAYDHPKLPKGFVTIEQLQGDLDLGDLRDEVEDFDFDGDITEAFGETAEYKVDDNYHALLTWLPDHTEWLEEAEFDGLLEGCKGDIYKMVQMAQYECFKSDLYDHREDISRYGTLDQLRDMGVYAIRESLADEILNDLSYDEDYAPTDDAKDTIMGAVNAAFEERYGEDFAEVATDWLEGDDLAKVNAFLKETCKEVFGILPGADDGGYSLSGEAKEAALSRFALPENRKAALNMIRKLNESRDSNDNAL